MMLIALKAIKKYLEVASFELYFKGFVSLICSKTHSVGQLWQEGYIADFEQ